MHQDDWIAACTVCGWMGGTNELSTLEGFDVCPECLSGVEWDRGTGGAEEYDEYDEEQMAEMAQQTFLERHWETGLPERPSSFGQSTTPRQPGTTATYRTHINGGDSVVASKPRQELLKTCMAMCYEQGMNLRWSRSPNRRNEGRDMLRATGRVCIGADEVTHDPAEA